MDFYEVLEHVLILLQRHGRVSYKALKCQFDLDDAYLQDLDEVLTEISEELRLKRVAIEEEGKVLIWAGEHPRALPTAPVTPQPDMAEATRVPSPAIPATLPRASPTTDLVVEPEPVRSGPEAERRQLTVMFCDLVDSTDLLGDRCYEAELYRLKGELMLKADFATNDGASTPEACLQKAVEIARRQESKSLELRAATSLARLWQFQGRRKEAGAFLGDVYSWFTEGFDTADLQEAKALLTALEAGA